MSGLHKDSPLIYPLRFFRNRIKDDIRLLEDDIDNLINAPTTDEETEGEEEETSDSYEDGYD